MRPRLPLPLSVGALLPLLAACAEPRPDEAPGPIEPYDPLPLVNPFIGTGGVAAEVVGLNPGAALPFGMTQVGPDTRDSLVGAPPFHHFGGYFFEDDLVTGFSHEHANGMGVNDFGTVLLMPRAGWDPAFTTEIGRAAPFAHERESASPGSYEVVLDDDGTEVEITATLRGGAHRWTFAAGAEPVALLDLGHQLGTVDVDGASVGVDLEAGTVDARQLLRGAYSGRYGGLKTWAHLSFEPAPTGTVVWVDGGEPVDGLLEAEGDTVGLALRFPAGTTEVVARVALSHVDADGARGNHEAELAGRDFETVRAAAEAAWREELGRVRVRGGTAEQRAIFHTALYHACLWPNVFFDADGRYRGFDDGVHTADFGYHTNFSMWDTFRTTHPWFTLARPDKARDFARSLVAMTEQGGHMPRWAHGHGYTGGMVGSPAAQILAGTWLKGVRDWDAEAAFDALYEQATVPGAPGGRGGLAELLELGWVPIEASGGSVSLAVEYGWNDHALALWADALGRIEEAEVLRAQKDLWRNHWDPDQRFMAGRWANGAFRDLPSAEAWVDVFVEGNAWHYLWPAPQDVEGMIELQHGGDVEAFLARYRTYWANVYVEEDDTFPDDFYWHGNEPDLHYAWLGSLAGRRHESARPVRHVMATRYSTAPNGLDGNDDAGTLSAWYLFAASGFYPVGGTTTYALGSPLFDRVEIDRPDGTLVIDAEGAGAEAEVPTAIFVGDEELPGGTVEHDTLIEAGGLRFTWD